LKLIVATVSFLFLLSLYGCLNEKPVPPEVNLVELQEASLWRAETHLYLPAQYSEYKENLIRAKKNLLRINSQFRWFRDYSAVQTEFRQLLTQGEDLFKKLQVEKELKTKLILERTETLRERLDVLSKLTFILHEGGPPRSNLAKAGVALSEAVILFKGNQFLSSEKKLTEAETYLTETEKGISPLLNRYSDLNLISKWKKWAKETIDESREKDIYCILIIKSEKKLILYKKGEPVKTYPVGLGKNGWLNKRRSRDNATPEGKYRIIGKNPRSRFYKALLINYPNENDRREFQNAKRKGLLLKKTNIGGLIEIHGGSKEAITYGCIALDNGHMEELYHIAGIGTPVTIVGALNEQNSISSILMEMQQGYGQKKTP